MKNRIKDDVAERISRQIERYKAEKKAVRKFIGPEYLAAGCVSIRFNKSEGLELSYDAKKHETYWHLDKTRVIWAPQDIEMLRKDSRYLPPNPQKEFAGNIKEFHYSIDETNKLGKRIINLQRVGPLENKLLADIEDEVIREIGIHMVAVATYLKNE